MGNTTFKSNSAGWRKMAVGEEIRGVVLEVATKGMTRAEELSADFAVTGDYGRSFRVRPATVILNTGFGAHPVAAGILENVSDHAAAVEWGNAHDHRPHRVLGRVLDGLDHG